MLIGIGVSEVFSICNFPICTENSNLYIVGILPWRPVLETRMKMISLSFLVEMDLKLHHFYIFLKKGADINTLPSAEMEPKWAFLDIEQERKTSG